MATVPPFITVSANKGDHVIARNQKAKVTIGLYFGKTGSNLVNDGDEVVLAIYDLGLYLTNQQRLANEANAGGLHEVDDTFFARDFDIPFDLQEHRVAKGTGLMFLAKPKLVKKPQAVNGSAWAVQEAPEVEEQESNAFSLLVEVETKTKAGFDATSIGIASLATEDFDAFVTQGDAQRRIAVRVLSKDLRTVLLCNMNIQRSTAGVAKPMRYINEPVPGREPQVFGTRKTDPDFTGMWVEDPPSERKRRIDRSIETAAEQVRAPATLIINQAGLSVVGWYVPDREVVLSNQVIPDFFSPNVREEMLDTKPRCLLGGHLQRKIQLSLQPFGILDHDSLGPHCKVFGTDETGLDAIDPLALFAENRDQLMAGSREIRLQQTTEFGITQMVVTQVKPPPEEGQEPKKWFFIRANSNSRVPNAVVKEVIKKSANGTQFQEELKKKLEEAKASSLAPDSVPTAEDILNSIRERTTNPTSPGVMRALVEQIVAPKMKNLLDRWMTARDDNNVTSQRFAEVDISKELERILLSFRPAEMTMGVAQAKRVAAARFVFFKGQNHVIMTALEDIVLVMLRRFAGGPGREDRFAELYDSEIARKQDRWGFALWGIRGSTRFEYKFDFTELSESAGRGILKGSAGGFRVTISGKDTKTDTVNLPAFKMVGAFIGGGIGIGASAKLAKKKPEASTGSGGPVSCTVKTHLDLQQADFEWAIFNTMALLKPSGSISAGPASIGNEWHETIFGVTLYNRSPTAQIETVVESCEFLVADPGTLNSVKDHFKEWKDAITSGDLDKVPVPGFNANLISLTGSVGVLIPESVAEREPDPYLVEDKTIPVIEEDMPIHWRFNSPAFQRGKHHLLPFAVMLLDHAWASYRKLLECAVSLKVDGVTSPEFGKLSRQAAADENKALSRARANSVLGSIKAALGDRGEGVLNPDLVIVPRGHGATLHRQTEDPADPDKTKILDPFCAAALDPNNEAAQQRLRRENGSMFAEGTDVRGVYRFLRRVDVQISGFIATRITEAPWKLNNDSSTP